MITLEAEPIIELIWSFTLTMHRLGKSKSPTDIPDSTQTSPAEPVQNPTPQRDSRTLAASSAATGAAFYDTRGTSSDGAAVRRSDTGWQTPYVADYRVRATSPTVIFTELPARFRYNKECTIEREKSTMTPRTFAVIPRTSVTILGTFLGAQRTFS